MQMKELFEPHVMTADSVLTLNGSRSLGGFLAKVSGTISITRDGRTAVDAVPVTAGVYTPTPMNIKSETVVTLAGGAVGTMFA